mgnify:CR=1 FL=1
MSHKTQAKKTEQRLERVETMQDTIMLDYIISTGFRFGRDTQANKYCVRGLADERRTAYHADPRDAVGELLIKEPLKTPTKSSS